MHRNRVSRIGACPDPGCQEVLIVERHSGHFTEL
jgi:hypothetical protein